jgi:hypothetical protein
MRAGNGAGGEAQKLERDVTGRARARTNTRASEPEKANKSTEQERERVRIHIPPTYGAREQYPPGALRSHTCLKGSKVLLRTKDTIKSTNPPPPPPNNFKLDTNQTFYKPMQFSRYSGLKYRDFYASGYYKNFSNFRLETND